MRLSETFYEVKCEKKDRKNDEIEEDTMKKNIKFIKDEQIDRFTKFNLINA